MLRAPHNPLSDYYRCPEESVRLASPGELPAEPGFFRFGDGALCYGRCRSGTHDHLNGNHPPNALSDIHFRNGSTHLPFDLGEVTDNLRLERYTENAALSRPGFIHPLLRDVYYSARPYLSDSVRGTLKRLSLRGWQDIRFPKWPVDRTVEELFEEILRFMLKNNSGASIPFIWFWPEGAAGCIAMTHDVESHAGKNACAELMDIDDSFGIKSSFQIVPEERYEVDADWLNNIWARGFEVNVQDFNHDGRLFEDHQEFCRRAESINRSAVQFGAAGFRAAVLYRNLDWLAALNVSYDMSVPNVAHLDPQHGGCCTVMPYFIGDILELPLTTTQDYMLFDILRDCSLDLWKAQTELILQKNGLASFLVHPDYLRTRQEKQLYKDLLAYLQSISSERNLWTALPGQIDVWWRQRSKMSLHHDGTEWRIQGPGSERARVAYAALAGDEVVYEIPQVRAPSGVSAQAHQAVAGPTSAS
jgi:hypothetical protein